MLVAPSSTRKATAKPEPSTALRTIGCEGPPYDVVPYAYDPYIPPTFKLSNGYAAGLDD